MNRVLHESLPNIDSSCFDAIDNDQLLSAANPSHPPRILLMYGSVRERSFSRLLSEEAARILRALGAETRTFDPSGMPLPTTRMPTTQRFRNCAMP